MSDCGCEVEIREQSERRVLWLLLAINAFMFVIEFSVGWLSESAGLIADSLDMLADAGVYSISLYVVGRTLRDKAHAAMGSGLFQIALAIGVTADVVRRFIVGSEPLADFMMGLGTLALLANVACLVLISKHKNGEVHMRASWIFSTNDVLANLGVIASGVIIHFTGSRIPDLVIGLIISGIVLFGGIRIVTEAQKAYTEA